MVDVRSVCVMGRRGVWVVYVIQSLVCVAGFFYNDTAPTEIYTE